MAQWGLAYAAGAWVLLQVLGFVSDSFAWPATVKQIATIILAVGLPIVVVLGWYHGERGQRRVSGPELAVLTLLLLIGGGLLWLYSQRSVPTTTTATAETPAPVPVAVDGRPSIAVLPFDNRSRLEDDAYFVDGIHDDILTQLSKVSALRVISRTSVEQFRDTKLSMKAIADQLGVSKILEGGVQRAGDRVRVTVQLIDAATDAHLWAENYDRELTAANIFAIQSELAGAIAGALKAALTPQEQARIDAIPTHNLEAWEVYQLGKQRMAKRTSAGLVEAERYFRKAVALDPGFALAYVGLADTLRLETDYSGKPLEPTLAEADTLVSKAIELDANLAEAWTSQGGIALSREQFANAEKLLRRAIELNPNYAPAHHWLSFALTRQGRYEEDIEHSIRAAQLDPLSVVIQINLGVSMEYTGRYDEAAMRYQRAMEIDPTAPGPPSTLAWLNAYARNRVADAVPLLERAIALDDGNPQYPTALAFIRLDMNEVSTASRLVAATLKKWPDNDWANSGAIALAAALRDTAAMERHAIKVLARYPRDTGSLQLLRAADLRRGDPKAAQARYATAFPELFAKTVPRLSLESCSAAVDLALVLQRMGEPDRAAALLDASERFTHSIPRLGAYGYGILDVSIHALRGDNAKAFAALREAKNAGWRGPLWRYFRDDPNLDSIRNEPEFKAVFADIERDMAQQRAAPRRASEGCAA